MKFKIRLLNAPKVYGGADFIAAVERRIREAMMIPPKILYAGFKPYVTVDNTKGTKAAGRDTDAEKMDREVTRLTAAGEYVKAVKLRRYYTNDTLKEAWDEVKRRRAARPFIIVDNTKDQ